MSLEVETIALDLPALVAGFGRRLHEAGVPVTPERSARFARALVLVRAGLAAAAVLHRARGARLRPRAVQGVRRRVRGGVRVADRRPGAAARGRPRASRRRPTTARPPTAAAPAEGAAPPAGGRRVRAGAATATRATSPCRSRPATRSGCAASASTRSSPASWPRSTGSWRGWRIAAPERRTRRAVRDRRGEHIDLRRTLRAQPAHRRRPDPARPPAPPRRPAPDRAAVRHLGLDGALRARLPAVPDLRRRQRAGRRGVRVRHAPDARDPRARLAQPGARDPARRGGRARLVERDAHRRRAARVQRPPRPPRDGPRRRDRDPLRRLGARRAGPRGPRDGAARARWRTGSCGSTRA